MQDMTRKYELGDAEKCLVAAIISNLQGTNESAQAIMAAGMIENIAGEAAKSRDLYAEARIAAQVAKKAAKKAQAAQDRAEAQARITPSGLAQAVRAAIIAAQEKARIAAQDRADAAKKYAAEARKTARSGVLSADAAQARIALKKAEKAEKAAISAAEKAGIAAEARIIAAQDRAAEKARIAARDAVQAQDRAEKARIAAEKSDILYKPRSAQDRAEAQARIAQIREVYADPAQAQAAQDRAEKAQAQAAQARIAAQEAAKKSDANIMDTQAQAQARIAAQEAAQARIAAQEAQAQARSLITLDDAIDADAERIYQARITPYAIREALALPYKIRDMINRERIAKLKSAVAVDQAVKAGIVDVAGAGRKMQSYSYLESLLSGVTNGDNNQIYTFKNKKSYNTAYYSAFKKFADSNTFDDNFIETEYILSAIKSAEAEAAIKSAEADEYREKAKKARKKSTKIDYLTAAEIADKKAANTLQIAENIGKNPVDYNSLRSNYDFRSDRGSEAAITLLSLCYERISTGKVVYTAENGEVKNTTSILTGFLTYLRKEAQERSYRQISLNQPVGTDRDAELQDFLSENSVITTISAEKTEAEKTAEAAQDLKKSEAVKILSGLGIDFSALKKAITAQPNLINVIAQITEKARIAQDQRIADTQAAKEYKIQYYKDLYDHAVFIDKNGSLLTGKQAIKAEAAQIRAENNIQNLRVKNTAEADPADTQAVNLFHKAKKPVTTELSGIKLTAAERAQDRRIAYQRNYADLVAAEANEIRAAIIAAQEKAAEDSKPGSHHALQAAIQYAGSRDRVMADIRDRMIADYQLFYKGFIQKKAIKNRLVKLYQQIAQEKAAIKARLLPYKLLLSQELFAK